MTAFSGQADLFDTGQEAGQARAAEARARMRGMIDRLRATDVPPWKDGMGVILDDGAFQRAMGLVPADEAQALWAEFDAQTERLHAVWVQSELAAGRG